MDWRVLDKKDGKVLLLKDNALGSTPFDEKGQNVTWESSSVREWLNKDLFRIGASSLVGDIEKRLGK